MPINDEELLAAVSGAADSADAPAPVETTAQETATDEDTDTATGGADDVAGDDSAGGDAPRSEDEGASGDDGDKPADEGTEEGTDEKEGDGTGVQAKKGEPKDELDPSTGKPYTPEALAEKKAKEEKEAFRKNQVEDPINAPIPKYLKETTQKRMTKLVEIAKDVTAKYESAQRDRDEIVGMIVDTGATAAQYTGALQYLKLVNSRDPAQIQQAIGIMQEELAALSRMAGVPVDGVDHLANHPDLKQAVEAKQLDAKLAQEIAAGRNQKLHQTQVQRATTQTQEQAQAAHNAGVKALNDIGAELKKADPAGYQARAQAVLAKIGEQLKAQHPSQWAQTFLVAYTTYKAPAPAARSTTTTVQRKAPVIPKNQPLRGNNPSGGQQKAPGSLEEAISLGIAAGTRR